MGTCDPFVFGERDSGTLEAERAQYAQGAPLTGTSQLIPMGMDWETMNIFDESFNDDEEEAWFDNEEEGDPDLGDGRHP